MTAKQLLVRAMHRLGYDLSRHYPGRDYAGERVGVDLNSDIATFLADTPAPVVFDVGANVGQSVRRFRDLLPGCTIHSFEPHPVSFRALEAVAGGLPDVHLVNAGVGAEPGTLSLSCYDQSDLNSYFPPGTVGVPGDGSVIGHVETEVVTLDDYCDQHAIERIDHLKIDTQGFNLEVVKGAERLIAEQRIGLLETEVLFSDMYEGTPSFDAHYRHLVEGGFRLVWFYQVVFRERGVSFADALFVHQAR